MKLGVKYERIHIKAPWDFIYSDKLWKSITINWEHYAVRIWDTIYDNINPKWLDINLWKKDLQFWSIDWPVFK